jgi:hypothetical protein
MKKDYYRAVVLDPNSWSPDDGYYDDYQVWHPQHCELDCCGHKHRTLQAAWECLLRQPQNVDWAINGHVVNQDDQTQDTSACDGRYN